MLDNLILCVGFASIVAVLVLILRLLSKISFGILENEALLRQLTYISSSKFRESAAEALLAEEGPAEPVEESLYLTKDKKYSYKVYDENKKRREKEKNPDDYIDDFEQAAEELEKSERKSKYAR